MLFQKYFSLVKSLSFTTKYHCVILHASKSGIYHWVKQNCQVFFHISDFIVYLSKQVLKTGMKTEGTHNHIEFKETQTTMRNMCSQRQTPIFQYPLHKVLAVPQLNGVVWLLSAFCLLSFLLLTQTWSDLISKPEFLKLWVSSWAFQIHLAVGTKEVLNM